MGGTVGSLPHVERSASERITPPQRTASKGSRSPPKEKAPFRVPFLLVEARRVELLSENRSAQLSPGGAVSLHSLARPPNGRLTGLVAPGTAKGREQAPPPFTTCRRPFRGRGPPRADGSLN